MSCKVNNGGKNDNRNGEFDCRQAGDVVAGSIMFVNLGLNSVVKINYGGANMLLYPGNPIPLPFLPGNINSAGAATGAMTGASAKGLCLDHTLYKYTFQGTGIGPQVNNLLITYSKLT